MKIGCSVHAQDLASAAEAGFDYAELPGREVVMLSTGELARLEAHCARLPCLGLNAYCPPKIVIAGPGFDRESARAYAQRLAPRAAGLGVRVVGIGSPASRLLPESFSRRLAWEQARVFTEDAAEVFGRYGIAVGFEALGYCYCNFINHLSEAAALIDSLDHCSAGLILDFYNMELSADTQLPLAPYMGRVLHVHLSDDLGTPGQRSFLRPEKLALHEAQIKSLLAAGYDATLTLEVDIPIGPAAEQSLSFLRNLTHHEDERI